MTWTAAHERFRKKNLAHRKVAEAIRKGELTRGECEQQSNRCHGQIQGHHEDYDQPLDVIWLCRRHHLDRHMELRRAAA